MDAATARVDGALLAPRLARPALAVAAGVDLALLRALVVAARDDGERRGRRLRRDEGLGTSNKGKQCDCYASHRCGALKLSDVV